MKFNVFSIPPFDRQFKRLAKKIPSFKSEYAALINSLETDPKQGTSIGNNCYKIRLAIASKGKGKSGGARVITHLQISKNAIYLLSVYDKSEQENIHSSELLSLLKFIPQ